MDGALRMRVFSVDYYLCPPKAEFDVTVSEFRGSDIKTVPVLRVFGATEDGWKACLHIHGVFPYLYIPCELPDPEPRQLYQIANSIDRAINVSLNQTNSAAQHVYKITPVKGIPFYGFHRKHHQFYKIYFYNPLYVKKAADLLQSGAIMEKIYQPHEAHINYVMQFFMDFNIYGMSLINFGLVKFRRKPSENGNGDALEDPISICEMEADALAQHILNKNEILDGNLGVNPGLEALWLDEKQRCKHLHSSASLLPTPSQTRVNVESTDSHKYHRRKLIAKLCLFADKLSENTDTSLTDTETQDTTITNNTVYPAETPDENDFLNASNVEHHHPVRHVKKMDKSVDCEDFLVDETILSECSQIIEASQLNSEDMHLVQALHDLQHVEDDSILGTPMEDDPDDKVDFDNVANEDILKRSNDNKCESPKLSLKPPEWNDSFWDNVQLSQLDGTWDDDNKPKIKGNKKLRVGLSKPVRTSKRKHSSVKIESSISEKLIKLNEQFLPYDRKTSSQPPKSPKKSPTKSPTKSPRRFDPLIIKIQQSSPVKKLLKDIPSQLKSPENIKCKPVTETVNLKIAKNLEPSPKSKNIAANFNIHSNSIHVNAENDKMLSSIPPTIPKKGLTSSQYDRQNNFVPEAGGSNINLTEIHSEEPLSYYFSNDISISENNQNVISFYDKTNYFDDSTFKTNADNEYSTEKPKIVSQVDFTNLDLKLTFSGSHKLLKSHIDDTALQKSTKVLIPKLSPPSPSLVKSSMLEHLISHSPRIEPFYSNINDTGAQIEIGSLILKVKSKCVQQLKEFPSKLSLIDLSSWREKIFLESNLSQINAERNDLDVLLSNNRSCSLVPILKPPSVQAVERWLNSNYHNNKRDDWKYELEDSYSSEKHLVIVPSSPGQKSCDSQNEPVSLTPISQSSNKSTKEYKGEKSILFEKSPNTSQETNNSDIVCGQQLKPDPCLLNPTDPENVALENSLGLLNSTHGFKYSGDNYQDAQVSHENEYLTILILEIHALTRGDLNPDPMIDPICAIYYSIINDCPENFRVPQYENGIYIIEERIEKFSCLYPEVDCEKYNIINVKGENELFDEVVTLIAKWDPDILCGYEIEMSSWGYLIQRANNFNINLISKISRVPTQKKRAESEFDHELKIVGRVTLNLWKVLRHEIALTSYTFENIFYHILHERIPTFSHKTLTYWWNHRSRHMRSMCILHFSRMVQGTVQILLQLDLIGRTSELAKLFGIQWYEVLSRGSQFRVESMMIRLAHPFDYVLVSPSIHQRAGMKAPECLPLILEPESRFYTDPIIVLDFQSLYPSMMIAYNYCFSTCIGKVDNIGKNTPFPFGASQLRLSTNLLKKLNERDMINWSPCGVGFVKPDIRHGILPKMLQDILNTRFMVKKSMKKNKADKTLQKILHNRQLGLKLIANVTYGYTAANFSGRMPCVEVGDSVVSKGRETLERAVQMIEKTPKWKAKVVYGDTDSLFILVPGRNKEEAFDIGAEIAEAVTQDNPTPVKLKFEKVYQPCILQTKKRYVGYMYESKTQTKPTYDAKGIETVRRDGCPATVKILEKTLRILFETYDVSKVKSYICQKFQNIIEDKCNLKDFIFAKEFRGMHAYKPMASIPALELARKFKQIDHRKEPREGERVPYVIISTAPGQTLLQSARSPQDLLSDPSLRLNYNYYITKVIIPPLNRCLTLIGVDVNQWFSQMPRKQYQMYPTIEEENNNPDCKKSTISQYFSKVNCPGCDFPTAEGLCQECIETPQKTLPILNYKINDWQRRYLQIKKICQSCCGRATQIECSSVDCPILFDLNTASRQLNQMAFIMQMKKKLLEF